MCFWKSGWINDKPLGVWFPCYLRVNGPVQTQQCCMCKASGAVQSAEHIARQWHCPCYLNCKAVHICSLMQKVMNISVCYSITHTHTQRQGIQKYPKVVFGWPITLRRSQFSIHLDHYFKSPTQKQWQESETHITRPNWSQATSFQIGVITTTCFE